MKENQSHLIHLIPSDLIYLLIPILYGVTLIGQCDDRLVGNYGLTSTHLIGTVTNTLFKKKNNITHRFDYQWSTRLVLQDILPLVIMKGVPPRSTSSHH